MFHVAEKVEEINLNLDEAPQITNQKSSIRNQVISAIICNLGMLCMGCVMGWSSPVTVQLEEMEWFSSSDSTWSGTLIPLGALVSLPIFGLISVKFGRKAGGYFCGFMFVIGLMFKAWGSTPSWLLVGRFFCGVGSGAATSLPTLYVGETVETKYRGILGSLLLTAESFGILYSYGIGMLLENRHDLSIIILPLPIIFLICFTFIPETPMQELRNGNQMGALKSLSWLRGLPLDSKQLQDELMHAAEQLGLQLPLPPRPPKEPFFRQILQRITCVQTYSPREMEWFSSSKKNSIKHSLKLLFRTRSGLQGLHITFALVTVQTFTGLFAILTYSNNIFEDAGAVLSPDVSSLICGFFFMGGAVFGCVFMDKLGRRVLQISSSLTIFICHLALSISLQLISDGHKSGFLSGIPIIALPLSIFANNVGLAVIPFVIMTEIFDLEIKDLATSIAMCYVWISVIILMTFFPLIVESISLINTFYIFAAFALLSVIHSYFFLIETKGKSLDEILTELSKPKKPKSETNLENNETNIENN